MRIELDRPCQGRTPCVEITIGDVRLLFSYQTLIAARSPRMFISRENVWGPTTGKHFAAWGIRGKDDRTRVPDEAKFHEMVEQDILHSIRDHVAHNILKGAA